MTGVGHMKFCKQDTVTLTTFVMDHVKQMQTASLFVDMSQQDMLSLPSFICCCVVTFVEFTFLIDRSP